MVWNGGHSSLTRLPLNPQWWGSTLKLLKLDAKLVVSTCHTTCTFIFIVIVIFYCWPNSCFIWWVWAGCVTSAFFPLNSFRFKDTYGSAMSLSYSFWDCATCWYEWGADQPWSCLRRSTQYFPSNECSSCSSSSCSSLREISSGKCLPLGAFGLENSSY